MKPQFQEKGQALIVIALAAIVLFGFAALAIDGSRTFSDKRQAQNAADSAALAAALAYSRGLDLNAAAMERTTDNGYDNGTTNDVTISVTNAPNGVCPANTAGKDIKVDIVSYVETTLARVVNQNQLINRVSATARSCASFYGPPFNGNAIVALAPTGKAYDGTGTPDWNITGGGIFSNSSSSNAAYCNGAADITAPSITVVGGTDLGCHGVNIPTTDTSASQYTPASIASLMPRQPSCDGTASFSGGQWHPQAGRDGSRVAFGENQVFAPGLYCITNSGNFTINSTISGSEVTFYIMNNTDFRMSFAGSGSGLNVSAPMSGDYEGILMIFKPAFDANGNLVQTQEMDFRGNSSGNVTGTIWAPSAEITMFGNNGTGAYNSQIIAYTVDSGGNANINIHYNPDDNEIKELPILLTLLR